MRTTARNLLAVLTFTLAGCISVPLPPPVTEPDPPPVVEPEPVRATLAVIVRDRDTGAALAGARVDLHTGETGTTNADGYAAFPDLVTGERGVTVQRAGYVSGFAAARPFTANQDVEIGLERIPPPPSPVPPPPVPACASVRPGDNLYPCLHEIATGRGAVHWQGCERGSGVSCFRWAVVVADVLAEHDARWGVLRKESPGQKCDWSTCGNLAVGWGEDIITYRLTDQEWRSWDIVTGAGSPGASYRGWHEVTGVGAPRPRYYWGASSMVQR